MAVFVKANGYPEHLNLAKHNWSVDVIGVYLSNTAPASETNNPMVLSDDCYITNVTPCTGIAYLTNDEITISSSGQENGIYQLLVADGLISAVGGTLGPFRYVYLYNKTNDAIIGMGDNVNSVTLTNGQSWAIEIDGTDNVLIELE